MATWDDVRRLAMALPEAAENPSHGHAREPSWEVRKKTFAWVRPLGKGDRAALGADVPDSPVLAARVEHEGAKLALIESDPAVYFTIPHFDGYSAVLVRLELIELDELRELLVDAWLTRAPKRLASGFLQAQQPSED